MNETLMKTVERIVRPLQAGKVRKLQMREELLAHLTAIYEEERERQPDEGRALAAATERFGDSAALVQELQSSLAWRDRWSWSSERGAAAIDRTFGYKPEEERVLSYLLRSGAWVAGLNLLLLALVMGLIALSGEGTFDSTFASFNRLTAVLFGHMILSETALLWAIQVTYQLVYRSVPAGRRLGLGLLNLFAWTLVFIVLGGGFWYGVTLSVDALWERLPTIAFWTIVTMPAIVLLVAWAADWDARKNQRYATWTRLELEE